MRLSHFSIAPIIAIGRRSFVLLTTFFSVRPTLLKSVIFVVSLSFYIQAFGQITVTNTADSGAGSLRDAISQANTNPGPDNIVFDNALIGMTISVGSTLTITSGNGDATSIDGDIDGDGDPDITLSGGSYSGIELLANNCSVNGLHFIGFVNSPNAAIDIDGSSGHTITGNYIGTNLTATATGTANFRGVALVNGASGNFIGNGTTAGQNIIGNNSFGIYINGSNTNTVSGNYIGLGADGSTDIGNLGSGIEVIGSTGILIGINGEARNLISGNSLEGISMTSTSSASIVNNYIGTDVIGNTNRGNNREGIFMDATSTASIGDGTAGGRNVISGNGQEGIQLASDNNVIIGNYIGLGANGTTDLGNATDGIWVQVGASGNTIGDGSVGGRNYISGNNQDGIRTSEGPTYIYGNYIGTNANGDAPVGNTRYGVFIAAGSSSAIGNAISGYGNLISGNGFGIRIIVSSNSVLGNYIGTDATGTSAIGNVNEGILLIGTATNNTIGNGTALGSNHISTNGTDGILFNGASVINNTVSNNSISNNSGAGISIINSAQNGVAPPIITSTLGGLITGTSIAGATIELFADTSDEGEQYLATTTADGSGDWSHQISLGSVNSGLNQITATQTSSINTSSFSASMMMNLPFITTWITTDNQITIPTFGGETYNYDITWTNLTNAGVGDGSITGRTGNYTITGLSNGDTYQIEISGIFSAIYFINGSERAKIRSVEQWGDTPWSTFEDAFYGCNNLVINAADAPDLSGVTSLRNTFRECTSMNQDISNWNVSSITDMISLFEGATSFNQDISTWNVSSVQFMLGMFMGASSFNQDISSWNVSSVTNMTNMFRITSFNQPIGSWTTSSLESSGSMFQDNPVFNQDLNWDMDLVVYASAMFWGATAFNGDISSWDMSGAINMSHMFRQATSFNGDISSWVVTSATDMGYMFSQASSFNQNIGGWDVSGVQDMVAMFLGATAFNQDISGWTLTGAPDLLSMFEDAASFNQDIGGWDVSFSTDLSFMFSGASAFNQDLSSWDVSNTTDMSFMFNDATSYNQSLATWDIGMVLFMDNMLDNTALSTANYDATLIGWADDNSGTETIPTSITLGAAGLTYCAGEPARTILTSGPYNWSITDAGQECAFITTWSTTDNEINIPTKSFETYNYNVTWTNITNATQGDGSITGQTGDYTITGLNNTDIYQIEITGTFPAIQFNNNATNRVKILTVEQWGDISWTSFSNAFYGCSSLTIPASDAPDLSLVTDMSNAFQNASAFNESMDHWDVSGVEDFSNMLRGASIYNQSLDGWIVSSALDMSNMFRDADAFNQDLNSWVPSLVTSMNGMFYSADSFDGAIGNWEVSSVLDMRSMFYLASNFSQSLTGWGTTTSLVQDMSLMFGNATSFNQPLNTWDVSSVTTMASMFDNAAVFNQDLNSWVTTSLQNLSNTFRDAVLFNGQIDQWDVDMVTTFAFMFDGAKVFNQPLNNWTVTGAINMQNMFRDADAFNQDLNSWTPTSVTDMFGMFSNCLIFNGDITTWDVSSVVDMGNMFFLAPAFNQPIGAWSTTTGGVLDMGGMFWDATSFNQDISSWDVSNVITMQNMFDGATAFNQDISGWTTTSIQSLSNTFRGASAFNQNLGGWDLTNATTLVAMLNGSGLSISNYDATLIGWEAQAPPAGLSLGATGLNYCAGAASKAILEAGPYNWNITDAGQECAFVTTWSTTDTQITIPTTGAGYNYDIMWVNLTNAGVGDGSITGQTGNYTITGLNNSDIYQIEITGTFPRIYFNNGAEGAKINTIEQWGDIGWTSMFRAFYGCTNLTSNAIDSPDLSGVTDLSQMFRAATSFNGSINNWDVSNVQNMSFMFFGATSFNQDISGWDVSSALNMSTMFHSATSFNQNISGWNVSAVTNMQSMFSNATSFNQDIGGWNVISALNMSGMFSDATAFDQNIDPWNVGSVTDMSFMFSGASAFNQNLTNWNIGSVTNLGSMFENATLFNGDIGNWDVSNVVDLEHIFLNATSFNQSINNWNVTNVTSLLSAFEGASSFNQDLSLWDVSNVTEMESTFLNATSFDQSLGSWDVSNVWFMGSMLDNSGLSIANYDATLIGWNGLPSLQSGVALDANGLAYCAGETARNSIIANYSWTFNDAGLTCPFPNDPTNLLTDATYGLNSPEVLLMWDDNSSDETDFEIERATDEAFSIGLQTFLYGGPNGVATASFSDNTVSSGALYFYRVRAVNAGGNSAYSNTITAVPVVEAGNSASFGSSTEYVGLAPTIGKSTEWTFTCWFKGNGRIYSEGGGASGIALFTIDTYPTWSFVLTQVYNSSNSPLWTDARTLGVKNQDDWNFFAISVSGATDGGSTTTVVLNNSVKTESLPVLKHPSTIMRAVFGRNVGSAYGGQPDSDFEGEIDEAATYSRALSAAEMLALRDSGINSGDPDLLSLWHFDEPNSSGIVHDASGNNNHGTRTNNPQQVTSLALHPFAPSLQVVPLNGQAEVSWNQSFESDFQHYTIEYKLSSAPSYTTIVETNLSITSRVITGLTNGELYDFRMSLTDAVDQEGPPTDIIEVPEIYAGNAASFDGTNSEITVPDNGIFNRGTGLTVEAWINPLNLNNTDQFLVGVSDAFRIGINANNELEVATNAGGGPVLSSETASLLNQDDWVHIAMTFDGTSTAKLFINGLLVHQNASMPVPQNSSQPFRMGANNAGTTFFEGLMDEVRLWDNELDQASIVANMFIPMRGDESNVGSFNANLIGLWHLDEPTGHSTAYSTPTNQFDGTLAGNADFVSSGAMANAEISTFFGVNNLGVEISNGQSTPIDLGSTTQGVDLEGVFTIENAGTLDMNVTSIVSSAPSFEILGAPTSVAIGSIENFTIRLDASETGLFSTTITISNNDLDESTFSFEVFGEVIPRNKSIHVYNVVTPNGDGKHDFLKIERITEHPGNRVSIFDRWGKMVYQASNYDNNEVKFEGHNTEGDNKLLPNGTYFYVIETSHEKTTGFIQISTSN